MPGFFDQGLDFQGSGQRYDVAGQGGSQALQQAYRSGAYNLEDPVPLVSAGLPPEVWRIPASGSGGGGGRAVESPPFTAPGPPSSVPVASPPSIWPLVVLIGLAVVLSRS